MTATQQAVAAAETAPMRAHALSLYAKALLRGQQAEAAKDALQQALELDPRNVSAFKRLAVQLLREGQHEAVVALSDAGLTKGICHSRLLAARSMALAAMGQSAAAQALSDPAFLYSRVLDASAGWESLESFNAAIVAELHANPAIRFGRYGTASEHSWRIDSPAISDAPAISALIDRIAQLAAKHAAGLGYRNHPWLTSRPATAVLRSWAVITEAAGNEQWHMHPNGWMSGGYYPLVPSAVTGGETSAGCLAFGLPGGLIGEGAAAAFGEPHVRPQPGLLTLFPSHAYHRTYELKINVEKLTI